MFRRKTYSISFKPEQLITHAQSSTAVPQGYLVVNLASYLKTIDVLYQAKVQEEADQWLTGMGATKLPPVRSKRKQGQPLLYMLDSRALS
jgi:hypothetical protein